MIILRNESTEFEKLHKNSTSSNLFVPITHLELKRLGGKAIHTFLRARDKYQLQIEGAKATGSYVVPLSILTSIDRDLLRL